jgi:hypothetical protein
MTARLAELCRDKHLGFNDKEFEIFSNNSRPPATYLCQRDAYIGLFFDGTNNNKYRDLPGGGASNVARLFEAFIASPAPQAATYGGKPNKPLAPPPPVKLADGSLAPGSIEMADFPYYRKIYIPGLGTAFKEINDSGDNCGAIGGDKTRGLAMALWGEDRIRWALIQVILQVAAMFGLQKQFSDKEQAGWTRSKDYVDQLKKRVVKAATSTPTIVSNPIITGAAASIYASMATLAETYINDAQFSADLKKLNAKLADTLPKTCGAELKKIRRLRLTVVGFSRGAAEARAFVNRLQSLCPTIGGLPWEIDFLGVFDTVASVGIANITPGADGHMGWADGSEMTIPPVVKRCVHLVAAHEVRRCFPLDSIASGGAMPKNSLEVVYPGVHSDVGGGYTPMDQGRCANDSDKISQISLAQMYREARMAGSPLIEALKMTDEVKPLFKISDLVRDKFDKYIKYSITKHGNQPATIETLIHRQYELYLAWRKFRLNANTQNGQPAIHQLPGLKSSTVDSAKQDIYDIWQLNELLKEELQPDIKTRLAQWITTHADHTRLWSVFLPYGSSSLLHLIQDPSGFQATRKFWKESAISLDKDRALIDLFDLYVHDSRAWFKFMGEADDEWFGGGKDPKGEKRASKKEQYRKEREKERARLQSEIDKLRTNSHANKVPAGWDTTVNGYKQSGIQILEAKRNKIDAELALYDQWGDTLQFAGVSSQEPLWMGAGYLRWRDIYTTRRPKSNVGAKAGSYINPNSASTSNASTYPAALQR